MTDRYLFRGFHPCENGTESVWIEGKERKGRWIYGNFMHCWVCKFGKKQDTYFIHRYETDDEICVLPETVGQYTGLTDKDGTKIFEGDVIEFVDVIKIDGSTNHKAVVEFNKDFSAIVIHADCGYYNINATQIKRYEMQVIGNIHSNPDILERKEK